jgi:mandelamide amidase
MTPLPAVPIGDDEKTKLNGQDVPTFPTFIRNADPGSNAGIPGITIPIARTQAGLPIGLGLDGPAGSDRKLLSIGLALEKLFGRVPAP